MGTPLKGNAKRMRSAIRRARWEVRLLVGNCANENPGPWNPGHESFVVGRLACCGNRLQCGACTVSMSTAVACALLFGFVFGPVASVAGPARTHPQPTHRLKEALASFPP